LDARLGLTSRSPAPRASSAAFAPQAPDTIHHDVATTPAVAVLLLARSRPGARLWGWSRVMRGERALVDVPGLRFARALGSGRDGGFGLVPSIDRHGLFALFDDDGAADHFIDRSPVTAAYRARANELLFVRLRATSCRGSWGGQRMAVSATADAAAPVAALTRAAIRPLRAAAFWRHAPPSERGLASTPGCRLAVGLGEAPLLRQATFSLWDNSAAMDAYARQGPHLAAIRAAQRGAYFAESMFVRLVATRLEGRWLGRTHG
jgi:hypothetical protein